MLRIRHLRWAVRPHHVFYAEVALSLFFSILIFNPLVQADGVVRLQDRSLLMNDTTPGATTTYTYSFQYTTETNIGSVDFLFCTDPIPDDPCDPPPGLDISHAVLDSQFGVTGYHMVIVSPTHFILEQDNPTPVTSIMSTYILTGVKNSTDTTFNFSTRLADYASTDATGTPIDIGSIASQVYNGQLLETQVPPRLTFCLGEQVSQDCTSNSDVHFHDMGNLSPTDTLTAQSQMAVSTNASQGFAITVNGTTMEAGSHIIDAITTPSLSTPGKNQFGINLVANSVPAIGADPDGDDSIASATAAYSQPNRYVFHDGDVIATSPAVSLIKRFTVSYIVNASPNLHAGVYSTTITYICSGRF